MYGFKGILSIIKKQNSQYLTSQEIEKGNFIVNFNGYAEC